MKMRSRLVIVQALVASLVAADSAAWASGQWTNYREVKGNELNQSPYQSLVRLKLNWGEFDGNSPVAKVSITGQCSGTLIGDRWLLTAMHCVYNTTDLPHGTGSAMSRIGNAWVKGLTFQFANEVDSSVVRNVRRMWAPNYLKTSNAHTDWALLELSVPVSVPALPMRETTGVGETVCVAGYPGANLGFEVSKQGSSNVESCTKISFVDMIKRGYNAEGLDTNTGHSGSGAWVKDPATGQVSIIGVNTRGTTRTSIGKLGKDIPTGMGRLVDQELSQLIESRVTGDRFTKATDAADGLVVLPSGRLNRLVSLGSVTDQTLPEEFSVFLDLKTNGQVPKKTTISMRLKCDRPGEKATEGLVRFKRRFSASDREEIKRAGGFEMKFKRADVCRVSS